MNNMKPVEQKEIDGIELYKSAGRQAPDTLVRTGKIGRNDPCLCGSEKKFKKCCIDKVIVNGITRPAEEPEDE